MTRPTERVAAPAAVDPGPHDLLLASLALALLARAALSFGDAWSLSKTGVRLLPPAGGATIAGSSPGWSIMWGSAALVAGLLLMRRLAVAWLLAAATCIAYLVTGIGDVSLFAGIGVGLSGATLLLFLVDLAAPSLVLAALFAVRPWFLSVARSARLRVPAPHRRPKA